jgi:hypothetical protein
MRDWGRTNKRADWATELYFASFYVAAEGLYGTDIAEFALIVIALSLVPALREFIRFTFQPAMRLRRIIACRPSGIFPFRRSVFIQFMKICHHSTFLCVEDDVAVTRVVLTRKESDISGKTSRPY